MGHAEESGIPAIFFNGVAGKNSLNVSFQLIALVTLIGILPGIIMASTAFLRIIIVLMILRQALGLNQIPGNQILLGLSFFMTVFVMSPIITQVNEQALKPYLAEKMKLEQAFDLASKPMKTFMTNHVRKTDLAFFAKLSKEKISTEKDIPWSVLLPSFVTSELKTAFLIGFVIFLPFLIIDLVVSTVLISMGMMMLSPMMISLPFKILLFVMIDGWSLILGSLASSFYM